MSIWEAQGPGVTLVKPCVDAEKDPRRKIVGFIIHYTDGNFDGDVDWLTKQDDVPVSAHYVIGRDGQVAQLCRIERVAYHAGMSWGDLNPNIYTIGYELCSNAKQEYKFTDFQYRFLAEHILWVCKKYNLIYRYPDGDPKSTRNKAYWKEWFLHSDGFIIGHSAVNPHKPDPGVFFDWDKLLQMFQQREGGSETRQPAAVAVEPKTFWKKFLPKKLLTSKK